MKNRNKLDQKIERKRFVEAGGYDGRFSPKVVKDKKKEARRNWAKQSNNN